MISIDTITLEAPDPVAARRFYDTAFGLGDRLALRGAPAMSSGYRGFTLSLLVSQPGNVDALFGAAVAGGAVVLKPAAKSIWGYGGVLQAPDGAIWKIATSARKDREPVSRAVEQIVLLLAAADVAASKRFYQQRGLAVGKSFGKYVEFAVPAGSIKLALYARTALAKDAGVSPEGSGPHGIELGGASDAFTDPDGFAWAPVDRSAPISTSQD